MICETNHFDEGYKASLAEFFGTEFKACPYTVTHSDICYHNMRSLYSVELNIKKISKRS